MASSIMISLLIGLTALDCLMGLKMSASETNGKLKWFLSAFQVKNKGGN